MEKFIGPRGSGRTYQICKYAIEHECDIIIVNHTRVQYIITVIMNICSESINTTKWTYCNYDFNTRSIQIDKPEKSIKIRIFTASDFTMSYFVNRTKPVVIDDVDECIKVLIGTCPVAAVSLATYNSVDIALKPIQKSKPCYCRSLI